MKRLFIVQNNKIILFIITVVFNNSCSSINTNDSKLSKEDICLLVDGELKNYLDSAYKNYDIYSKSIRLIDSSNVKNDIQNFINNKEEYFVYKDIKVRNSFLPTIDSLNLRSLGVSNLSFGDSIPSLHSNAKMLGITLPFCSSGYCFVQIKRVFKSVNGFCGTGLEYYKTVYFKKVENQWEYQFDVED